MRKVVRYLLLVLLILLLWGLVLWIRPFFAALRNHWPSLLLVAAVVIGLALWIRLSRPGLFERVIVVVYGVVNRWVPWHRLSRYVGAINLDAFRATLREKNLHDVPEGPMPPLEWEPAVSTARTSDGSFNDLDNPNMGRAGMRFGRNIPLSRVVRQADQRLLEPNPREISRKLMTRDSFKPATTLNMLAAAWIQFQVHGWLSHVRDNDDLHRIPIEPGDPWPRDTMEIEKTLAASEENAEFPRTFANVESHWWDGSQLYGSTREIQRSLRSGEQGKLLVEPHDKLFENRLPEQSTAQLKGLDLTGFFDNYWVGLSMFHTIFALEHNAICDRLQEAYPVWSDDQLFNTARLINCALIAKIHTVEWTPAILAHPTLRVSMDANWWGLFGENIKKSIGRLSDREEISGIVGSPTDHHAASYSLTEEFTSVYRLHALIPDDFEFYSATSGELIKQATFTEIQGTGTRPTMDDLRLGDLFYSFGIVHPGAITLHNFPKSLQEFTRLDGRVLDLAAVDILRDRERGVPRYNEFRRLLHMKPVGSFTELTGNPEWAREIEQAYQGDIEAVDLMVGLYAEPPPKGFGFSDTAFRIFILMASRRLKSDRFFTRDYSAEVYTQLGLDWVDENDMASILIRHCPTVAPAIQGIQNTFAPWDSVTKTRPV